MVPALRWALPFGLLLVEGLILSVLVDLPSTGETLPLVQAARLAVPVLIGGGAAAWLIARRPATAPAVQLPGLPEWRPAPVLGIQLVAFGFLAWWTWRLMGDGAPPLALSSGLAWLAGAVGTVLLAVASAAPLGWLGRVLVQRWRLPLLALAAGLLAWRAAAAAEGLWGVLTSSTLHGVIALVSLARSDVVVDLAEHVVGAGSFEVAIAPICSGVDGLGLVVLFQALWIALARSRLRFPRALLLLPLGAAVAFGANILRIAALVLLGAAGLQQLAWGGFHSKLGWLFFIAIALGSVALAERSRWLRREEEGAEEEGGVPHAAAAYIAPLLAALATALLTGIFEGKPPERFYLLRILAAVAALAAVRGSLPRPRLSFSPVALALGLAVGLGWVALAGSESELGAGLAALSPGARWAWIAVRVAGACLVIPVVEELAFRGFLLPWLSSPDFEAVPARTTSWPAVALSSLAFGALHPNWILGTVAGVAFAAARWHRGKLGDAVAAHAVANAVVAAAAIFGGRWDLW